MPPYYQRSQCARLDPTVYAVQYCFWPTFGLDGIAKTIPMKECGLFLQSVKDAALRLDVKGRCSVLQAPTSLSQGTPVASLRRAT